MNSVYIMSMEGMKHMSMLLQVSIKQQLVKRDFNFHIRILAVLMLPEFSTLALCAAEAECMAVASLTTAPAH